MVKLLRPIGLRENNMDCKKCKSRMIIKSTDTMPTLAITSRLYVCPKCKTECLIQKQRTSTINIEWRDTK